MSVPQSKQTEGELKVFTKARALVVRTLSLCSNEGYFSKKKRWVVSGKMCDLVNEMFTNILKANSVYVELDGADANLRIICWKKALASSEALLGFIDLSDEFSKLSIEKRASWSAQTKEVQTLIRNRIKSDMKRYKNG